MTYQESLDWLYTTQTFGIKLGLDAPRELLRQFLAYPKHGVKVAHIAGTNGKGSTAAFLDSLTRSTAHRTGLFTSPHLIHYRERIRVNGEMISEETVATYLTELRELVANWEYHPTFFELTLAVAMRHFRKTDCEIIILETGMGGRLDATTAVPADIAIITPIAMDHSEYLGDTIAKVALEKAGIIPEHKPTITAKQHPEAAQVIAQEANQQRSNLTTINTPLTGYSLGLVGPHQAENAHLALEAASILGVQLNFDTVQYALANIKWPGRFETISNKPTIIIDGAHNPHAAQALLKTWQQTHPDQKAALIFGAVEEKDIANTLGPLAEIAEHIYLTEIDSPRTLTTETLAQALPKNAPPHTQHKTLTAALAQTKQTAPNAPILIAGSLYLIGQAKALLQEDQTETYQPSTQ